MRHPDDERVDAIAAGHVDDLLQRRDEHLAALQTEALLRRPLLGEELLEARRADESLEEHLLLLGTQLRGVRQFEPGAQPLALVLLRYVHVLDADV